MHGTNVKKIVIEQFQRTEMNVRGLEL